MSLCTFLVISLNHSRYICCSPIWQHYHSFDRLMKFSLYFSCIFICPFIQVVSLIREPLTTHSCFCLRGEFHSCHLKISHPDFSSMSAALKITLLTYYLHFLTSLTVLKIELNCPLNFWASLYTIMQHSFNLNLCQPHFFPYVPLVYTMKAYFTVLMP